MTLHYIYLILKIAKRFTMLSISLFFAKMVNLFLLVRPAVNKAVRLKIKEYLRRYIIAPVIKCIDNDEPLEYLTEMRQAVTVFINVVSKKLNNDDETCILADKVYKIVCRLVQNLVLTILR